MVGIFSSTSRSSVKGWRKTKYHTKKEENVCSYVVDEYTYTRDDVESFILSYWLVL